MAETAGGMSLGTLTVQLAADVSSLRAEFNKAFRETEKLNAEAHKLSAQFERAFGGVQTAATRLAGNFNQVGEAIQKVFGERGLVGAKALAAHLGISEKSIESISTSLKGLGGVFSTVSVAAAGLSLPLLAAAAAVVSLITLAGALKRAYGDDVFSNAAGKIKDWAGNRKQEAAKAAAKSGGFDAYAAQFTTGITGHDINVAKHGEAWDLIAPDEEKPDIKKLILDTLGELKTDFEKGIEPLKDVFAGLQADTSKQDLEEQKKLAKDAIAAEKERQAALREAFEQNQKIVDDEERVRKEEAEALKQRLEERQRAEEQYANSVVDCIGRRLDAERQFAEAIAQQANRLYSSNNNRLGGISASGMDIIVRGDNETERELNFESGLADLDARTRHDQSTSAVGSMALDTIKSGAGRYTSSGISGAAQGAQAGGPWGAVIGAVLGLLSQSEGFASAMQSLEEVIGPIAEFIGESVGPLSYILDAIGGIIQPILAMLAPTISQAAPYFMQIAKMIQPIAGIVGAVAGAIGDLFESFKLFDVGLKAVVVVVNALGNVFKYVQGALGYVMYGIQKVYNAILTELAHWISYLSDELAGEIRSKRVDAEATKREADQAFADANSGWSWDALTDDSMPAATEAVDSFGDATDEATTKLQEFSDSMINAVSGYKLGLAQFNAALGMGQAGYSGGDSSSGDGMANRSYMPSGGEQKIEMHVQIVSSDPERIWSQLQKVIERKNFMRTGNIVARGPLSLAGA